MTYHYSAGQLLKVKRWFDQNPDGIFVVPKVWPEQRLTKEQWHAWFLDCLHNKINRNEPLRGRKDDPDWQRMIQNVAREVNTPRLIVHWLPRELKPRLSHRLWKEE